MSAAGIITQARRAGVVLSRGKSGGLDYRTPAGPLPGWLRSLLVRHKPAILDALAAAESAPTPTPRPQASSPTAATVSRPADVYEVRPKPGAQWFTCIEQDDRVTGERATLEQVRAMWRRQYGPECETRKKEVGR